MFRTVISFLMLVVPFSLSAHTGSGLFPDRVTHEFQGGTPDQEDDSVGILYSVTATEVATCTGTLIAPSTILTAAHCVETPLKGFYIGSGAAVTDTIDPEHLGMIGTAVDDQLAFPGYDTESDCPADSTDVGLVHLASPITEAHPAPVNFDVPRQGQTCHGIGFGIHNESTGKITSMEKRTGTQIVNLVDAFNIQVAVGTGLADAGDSGGPLACDGTIMGVVSCHNDGKWPKHKLEYYSRIDKAADWIRSTVSTWEKQPVSPN